MKVLVFDYIITPAASIKHLRSQITWFSQMAEIGNAFVAPDNLPEGNRQEKIACEHFDNEFFFKLIF